MKWFKKGQASLNSLLGMGMVFVATAIGLAFGAKVTKEISDDLDTGSTAKAIADNGTESLNVIGKWLPTLALVAIAAVIVALVVSAFALARR